MTRYKIRFKNWSKKTATSDKTEFRTDNATREEIEACLEQTRHDSCYFSLEKFFKGGSAEITFFSEGEEYYMLYSDTRDEDGDVIIKKYYHPHRSLEKKLNLVMNFFPIR